MATNGKSSKPAVEFPREIYKPEYPRNHDRFIGLINLGNMCYCNSVLQLLYYCRAFRESVNNYPEKRSYPKETQASMEKWEKFYDHKRVEAEAELKKMRIKMGLTKEEDKRKGDTKGSLGNTCNDTNSDGVNSSSNGNNGANGKESGKYGQANGGERTTTVGGSTPMAGAAGMMYMDESNSSIKYRIPAGMFTVLKDLFWYTSTRVSRVGTYNPNLLITQLKVSNALFRNNDHQDAHEMFNYLINEIAEIVDRVDTERAEREYGKGKGGARNDVFDSKGMLISGKTWVHTLFEGLLTNETKCLTCEAVSSRDEKFFDLSLDVVNNSSVTSLLRDYAKGEIMKQANKFYCEKCGALQEAERRVRLKRLPNILALHLKRFKYVESQYQYVKLSYRVNYPKFLRVPEMTEEANDVKYRLVGAIIHLGGGLNQGHYIVIINSDGKWVLFDDDYVDLIDESELELYNGDSLTFGGVYVLLYEREDLDSAQLDLPFNSEFNAFKARKQKDAQKKEKESNKVNGDAGNLNNDSNTSANGSSDGSSGSSRGGDINSSNDDKLASSQECNAPDQSDLLASLQPQPEINRQKIYLRNKPSITNVTFSTTASGTTQTPKSST